MKQMRSQLCEDFRDYLASIERAKDEVQGGSPELAAAAGLEDVRHTLIQAPTTTPHHART